MKINYVPGEIYFGRGQIITLLGRINKSLLLIQIPIPMNTEKQSLKKLRILLSGVIIIHWGTQESQRIHLVKISKESLFHHRLLQSHIKKSYPHFLRKSKLRDAGVSLYRKASRSHWDSLIELLKKGEEFIKENHKVLSESGMPAHFPGKYYSMVKDFQELHDKYKAIMEYNDEAAANRIKQLNKLYMQTIDMFSDAQLIMRGKAKVFRSLSLTQSMNYYKRKNKNNEKQLQLALQIKPVRKNKTKEKISKQKAA